MFPKTLLFLLLGVAARNAIVSGAPPAPMASGEDVGYSDTSRSHPIGSTFYQDIVWQSCDDFGVILPLPGLNCSHVEVPMDYHNSSAGTANLAVIKYTAVEPGKSKGSIFINPGMYSCNTLKTAPLIYLGKVVLAGQEPSLSLYSLNP